MSAAIRTAKGIDDDGLGGDSMTFLDGNYTVTVIATLPDTDSYTATKMWLRDYAIMKREAARYNDSEGYSFAADKYREDANRITEGLECLE